MKLMKLMKRTGIYQCSNYNCTFNPKTLQAHSYKWWKFVALVEGVVVFNNYRYSVSTSKHQSKVESLMSQLGIKIDMFLKLPNGINSDSLAELIQTAEETECDMILNEALKRDERNERARIKRAELKRRQSAQTVKAALEAYLEYTVHFRDYQIQPKSQFGQLNIIAVHQVVAADSIERDVQNALYNFHRDGFGKVVFYV